MKVNTHRGEETRDDAWAAEGTVPEQIFANLRDAAAMLNAGKDRATVLHAEGISKATLARWRAEHRREAVGAAR